MSELQSKPVIELIEYLGYDMSQILIVDLAELREFIVNKILEVDV